MPQRFVATENAFDKGIENTTPKAGAKLAGEWAEAVKAFRQAAAVEAHRPVSGIDLDGRGFFVEIQVRAREVARVLDGHERPMAAQAAGERADAGRAAGHA